jgi:Putative zinc-finger
MDHDEAVRLKAPEGYLLDELDPDLKDQFEEHLFDCRDCALDVRAAAMFVEQSKVLLSGPAVTSSGLASAPAPPNAGWLDWFRPAFAVPILALLLVVVGYESFVRYPRLMQAANQPQVGPWASVNVSTRGGATTVIKAHPGEGFGLLVNLPSEDGFVSYTADLYNPAGKLEWSGAISTAGDEESRQIYIPGRNRQAVAYTLVVHGISAAGESKEISRHLIKVQIQN